jgi:hypothetical protein
MALPPELVTQAVFANDHSLMLSDVMRLVFIDVRENIERVPKSESVVAEVVVTRAEAQRLANSITSMLTLPPPKSPK